MVKILLSSSPFLCTNISEILPSTCRFQYIDNKWPYLNANTIHAHRDDIQWLAIQHSIIDKKQMQTQNLSIINSIVYNQCNLGENVTIYNSIVGNRVTLGDNCCIQSVDFSKEVGRQKQMN